MVKRLRRSLGLPLVTLYGLGNILGAGIYVLIGKVAGAAGYSIVLSFIIAMIVAGLTAFSYMELSGRFPASASVSVYLHKAFGQRWLSLLVGLAMVAAGITSAATLAKGFAGYMQVFVSLPEVLLSTLLLVVIGMIALKGIGESAWVAGVFTFVEIAGLLLVIIIGRHNIGVVPAGQLLTIDPAVGWTGVMGGAFLAFYAFIGFEDMVNVAEETKNPQRTMPLAILISLVCSTILYLLVAVVAISSATPQELAASEAPLLLVLNGGLAGVFLTVIGISAAINGVIVQVIMGSRILFGLSRRGWLDAHLAEVDNQSRTPVVATLLVVGLMILAVVALPLISLARLTSLIVLLIFALVNIALITIKNRHPNHKGVITVPKIVPYLGAISCSLVVLYEILAV